jgi:hypothetical protein
VIRKTSGEKRQRTAVSLEDIRAIVGFLASLSKQFFFKLKGKQPHRAVP